jgi:uncharacterized membrane protein SirB2
MDTSQEGGREVIEVTSFRNRAARYFRARPVMTERLLIAAGVVILAVFAAYVIKG